MADVRFSEEFETLKGVRVRIGKKDDPHKGTITSCCRSVDGTITAWILEDATNRVQPWEVDEISNLYVITDENDKAKVESCYEDRIRHEIDRLMTYYCHTSYRPQDNDLPTLYEYIQSIGKKKVEEAV